MNTSFKNLVKAAIGYPAAAMFHIVRGSIVYVETRRLAAALDRCGKAVEIIYPWDIRGAQSIRIGDGAYIGPGVFMLAEPDTPIAIGSKVMFGPRVRVIASQHRIDDPTIPIIDAGYSPAGNIVIGDESWIGTGATILKGVTIGRGAVVGAGAVITKDVPAFEIWAGNPARKIRSRLEVPESALSRAGS
jgi:acetyltransferase-like isoleucine patch superfamily enzyme